jgi:hypothetical protein
MLYKFTELIEKYVSPEKRDKKAVSALKIQDISIIS